MCQKIYGYRVVCGHWIVVHMREKPDAALRAANVNIFISIIL